MTLRPLPPLHVVTDDAVAGRPDFADRAIEVFGAGGGSVALHLRMPHGTGRAVHDLAVRLAEAADRSGSILVVNDRVDVAMAAGAHGVQVGRRGLPIEDARRLVGPDRMIGASVHSADEASDAIDRGADYLVAGTVFASASHPDRPGAGVGLIERIALLGRPVIAIGGITVDRIAEVKDAGAAGGAAIRGVWDAADPAEAINRYLDAWRR